MADLLSARDIEFLLYEMLNVEGLCASSSFAGHDRTTFDAALDAAARLAREQFAPHAAAADACEPLINDTDISGNIAFIERGGCNFDVKIQNAGDAGAVAAD